jgi:aminopeptidase N/puromycin-sensitive aminopeptidase
MAHQWFGDMVTMQWWDNLWLNEGFATWMESKPVAKWHPEWNFIEDDASELDSTLNLDSQATTRTIRARAETPSEINEMFDGIAYGKAGAVLNMVENYLGEETFRQGVHNYLAAHLYANATAEDFWNAQTQNSHLPVDKIMQSFVTQPGVPLLTLSGSTGASIPVAQTRFFLSGAQSATAQSWTLPVCVKSSGKPICSVLTPNEQSISLPAGAALPTLFVNAGARGYYRTLYTSPQFADLVAKAETTLTPSERITLLGDQWALVRSGQRPIGDFMNLLLALKGDPNAEVMESLVSKLRSIDARIASDDDRKLLASILRREFGPVYQSLGEPTKNESYDRLQRRATLFGLLGDAHDPAIVTKAREIAAAAYNASGKKQQVADPLLADVAVNVAANSGDAALYDKVFAASKDPSNPEDQSDALRALTQFSDPGLVKRTLDYAVSGQVRNQDSWILPTILLIDRDTRNQTWDYIRNNWQDVHAQFTTNSGPRVVNATGSFCSIERRDEVSSFFAVHKVVASDRTLAKAIDAINDCVHLREAQQPSLHAWLLEKSKP